MEFRTAFLNCRRLYDIGQHDEHSPPNDADLARKIKGLSAGLRRAFSPAVPDLIGLCEIGTEPLAREVVDVSRAKPYGLIWQMPPTSSNPRRPTTGLALAYDEDIFAVEQEMAGELTPGEDHRFHWLAVRMRLRRTGPASRGLWVVVNHWPSDYRSGPTRGAWPRALVSKMIAEFLVGKGFAVCPAALMMGDFNCEPFDAPLTGALLAGDRIVAVREHARVLNEATFLPYFYNPMWRLLGEPTPLEEKRNHQTTRPPGTQASWETMTKPSAEWRNLDQILVNRPLLRGQPATMVESSMVIVETDERASDHLVVGARFQYEV